MKGEEEVLEQMEEEVKHGVYDEWDTMSGDCETWGREGREAKNRWLRGENVCRWGGGVGLDKKRRKE